MKKSNLVRSPKAQSIRNVVGRFKVEEPAMTSSSRVVIANDGHL